MASINIKSNIGAVTADIARKLAALADKEYMPRILSFDLIDQMTKRIHIDGKDSKDAGIGTYSKGYMALRTGDFKNSQKFTRGKNKGKNKDAGILTKKKTQLFGTTQSVFADVTPMGIARPKHNRSSDTKVIISLTRQLENDWSVIATNKGYGIGFLNSHNFDKAKWTEATYKKKIFPLSPKELNYVQETIQELTTNGLK